MTLSGSAVLESMMAIMDERDRLVIEVAQMRSREIEIGRKLYRRGYLTGYMAGKQRRARETAPERHARGWAREMIG